MEKERSYNKMMSSQQQIKYEFINHLCNGENLKTFILADENEDLKGKAKDFYFQFTNTILIKTAPILDLHAGLLELKNVAEIHIVAVDNEVKELLWKIEKNFNDSPEIIAVNIEKEKQTITKIESSKSYSARYNLPKKYLHLDYVSHRTDGLEID